MTTEQINYEAVLADLKARRDALNDAIAGIERILGLAPSPNGTTAGQATHDLQTIPSDAFFGLSIPDALKKCLGMLKRKQSVKILCDALGRGGLNSTAKNFYATVYSALVRMEKAGDIVKIDTKWGLPDWYPGMRKDRTRRKAAVVVDEQAATPDSPPAAETAASKEEAGPSMRARARDVLAKASKPLRAHEIAQQLASEGQPVEIRSLQAALAAMVKHNQIGRVSAGKYSAV
ncbi:MAG: hypothetical protein ABSA52_20045 [Candidatus Binatia bacterium]|jgi:hypothetical protein